MRGEDDVFVSRRALAPVVGFAYSETAASAVRLRLDTNRG